MHAAPISGPNNGEGPIELMRYYLGSLLLLLPIACGPTASPSERIVLSCDLSESRHLRNVVPQKASVGGMRSYEGQVSLRLRVESGWTFNRDVYLVLLHEEEEQVKSLLVKTDGLTLDQAETLAASLCRDWGLDPGELEMWLARIKAEPLYPSLYEKSTQGKAPYFTLGFAHSGLREAPWSIYFKILWK